MLNEQKSIEGFYTQLFHLYDVKIQNDASIHPFHPIKIHDLKEVMIFSIEKCVVEMMSSFNMDYPVGG